MHEQPVGALEVAAFDQRRIAHRVRCVRAYSVLDRVAALELLNALLGNLKRVIRMRAPRVWKLQD